MDSEREDQLIDKIRDLEEQLAEAKTGGEWADLLELLETEPQIDSKEAQYLKHTKQLVSTVMGNLPIFATYSDCKWSTLLYRMLNDLVNCLDSRQERLERSIDEEHLQE